MAEPANLDLLKAALAENPRAVVGAAPDGRLIIVLERLSADSRMLTKFGLALRWLDGDVEKVTPGVWLVPAGWAGGGGGAGGGAVVDVSDSAVELSADSILGEI